MEKTIQITLATMTFSLTESAFEKLSAYLERLKAHFAGETEREEIMRDIESRIAEKLFHKKQHVVTEDDITAITTEIGDASEFDDDAGEPAEQKPGSRRLYRDTDNAMLAGVAAGLAAYFDIDPIWIRLLFLISIFFGGTGILLYIILWILMPEAKTASQKLEMRGHAVDLEGIARVVRESVDEARERGVVRKFFEAIRRAVSRFFRVIGRIFGALIALGAFSGFIALMIGVGVIATNWNAPYNDFPLREAISDPLLIATLVAGFVAILIPLIAIFALGIRLMLRRTIIPGIVAFGLIGIWALAVSAVGTLGVKIAGEYYEFTQTDPAHQMETRTLEVAAFSSVDISDAHVVMKSGDTQSVTIEGRIASLDEITAEVNAGTLTLTEIDRPERMCIFCTRSHPTITITTPALTDIAVEAGSINFEEYRGTKLALTSRSSYVRGTLEVPNLTVDIERGSMSADLTTSTLSLTASDAHVILDGSATTATISLAGSNLNARTLAITDAHIEADGSRAEMNVSGTLENPHIIESWITNVGRNQLERIESHTSN